MADLENLLDELNNDNDNASDNLERQANDGDYDGVVPERAGVPSALAAVTAARRRRPLNDGDLDAGDEDGGNFQASASPSRAATRPDRYGREDDLVDDDDDDDTSRNYNPDYEQLKALWTSELACPELLPHDSETIAQNINDLAEKEELVDILHQRSRMQGTSAGGGGRQSSRVEQQGVSGELASLVAQITKMDLDRTRFMLVDLARIRMAKIENHALHNRTLVDRMTEEEVRELHLFLLIF